MNDDIEVGFGFEIKYYKPPGKVGIGITMHDGQMVALEFTNEEFLSKFMPHIMDLCTRAKLERSQSSSDDKETGGETI